MPGPPYHWPNPLDLVFLALDDARRRCGMPPVRIFLHLELEGSLDVAGMQRALRGVHRLFPALSGRLERVGWLRRSAWRLEQRSSEPVVAVQQLGSPVESDFQRIIERLIDEPASADGDASFQLRVLRGLPAGDVLVASWPHALMDARGGVTVLEELARLFEEGAPPESITSAGDERRMDFGRLGQATSAWSEMRRAMSRVGTGATNSSGRRPTLEPLRPDSALATEDQRYGGAAGVCAQLYSRMVIRRLTAEQAAQVQTNALRICGVARLADFIRACAIAALHEVAGTSATPDAAYSTLHLIDNRRRRDPGPVCHNVFTAFPVHVPAALAADRRTVADLIQAQATAWLEPGRMERRLAQLGLLTRLPTDVLGRLMARTLRGGRGLALGLGQAPSLPLGFMGPLTRPRTHFCGARLVNLYGLRPASPRSGFALNVNLAQDRMNLAAVYLEPLVEGDRIERLLDRFVAALLDEA